MLSYPSSSRQTVRWYKKVGVYILEILPINAHYIYLNYSGGAIFLNVTRFKEAVITKLIDELKKTIAVQIKANFSLPHIDPTYREKKKHCSCKSNIPRKELRYIWSLCPDQTAICVDHRFRLWYQYRQEQRSSSSSESGRDQSSFYPFPPLQFYDSTMVSLHSTVSPWDWGQIAISSLKHVKRQKLANFTQKQDIYLTGLKMSCVVFGMYTRYILV